MFKQVTIAEQTGLSLTLVESSQDRIPRDGAHSLTPSTTKNHSHFWAIFPVVCRFDISRGCTVTFHLTN